MKVKKIMRETIDSRTYRLIVNSIVSGCTICSPHKGCNKWYSGNVNRNWKNYRKTQWK